MPKILYIWQAGFPWDVRAEKICLELISRGCEITLLARWKPGQERQGDHRGIRVVRVGHQLPRGLSLPVPMNPTWRRSIRRMVADWRPDLVIAREIMLAEPAADACRRQGVPMIIDMAEHYPATMRTWEKYGNGFISRLLVHHVRVPDLVERRAVASADGVITVCDEQIDRLHEQYGYPRDRTAVVHNTIDRGAFEAVRRGSSTPPRVFGHHGHITSQRGLDHLIRGFALAARHDSQIRLVLAGSGEISGLAALARDLGASARVSLVGPYRHADLIRLYSEVDVGILAYPVDDSWGHSIPNKLFDYLACGKPVIVSPNQPFRRVVEEAKAGLVLADNSPEEIAAAMLRMRRLDPEPMAKGGLEAARTRFHWARDAETMVEFLSRFVPFPHPRSDLLAARPLGRTPKRIADFGFKIPKTDAKGSSETEISPASSPGVAQA
jgi:glycosyltransferase involved in cell wall biosynthesis